ncbi:AMP-binding protein [Streptomyces sp. NPDC005731]|uniref:AMP-binding protein n=1 Tax=Streptomyces sp. NPDC005731 TaxID=3157056 RepID=UPI00340C7EDD
MRQALGRESTAGGLALRALRRYPNRIAFAWDGGSLTYAAALDVIGRMQAVFAGHGLRPGQCMALLSGNRAEAWCAGVAAQAFGLTVTWLHPSAPAEDHAHQVNDAGADVLLVDVRRFAECGGALAAHPGGFQAVFTLGPADYGTDLIREAEHVGSCAARDVATPEGIASLYYTGGTTGFAKGVAAAHPWLATLTATVLNDFELPQCPRYLAVGPISHVTGSKIVPALVRGGTVHLLDGFSPTEVLAAIEREHINVTLLAPPMIYALLDDPALGNADLASLELLLYGASAITPDRLAEGLDRIGGVFSQFYGQTECYPISLLRRTEHAPERPELLTSAGRPVTASTVAILDDEGNEVSTGDTGEICVRSPLAMNGYHRRPALTEEVFAHGWLHTGDIGRVDDRGYVFIVDRKKDMIIRNGVNVFSRGVEIALSEHPAVSQAAVFGTPDAVTGEAVNAAVVLHRGTYADADALTRYVRERRGHLQAPQRIYFVDEVPMTNLGKADKRALRESLTAR